VHSPAAPAAPSLTRAIVFLAAAGFASQCMVRSADSLLPQIAGDLGVTVGVASIIVSAYSFVHGSMQLFMGAAADRFGKYRTCAVTCGICSIFVALCGLAPTLTSLLMARIASAAFAAWIIPLGMAYIGDAVPYERRQPVLARYLSGQISGQLFGQAAGGILGDLLGWRGVFFVLAGFLAIAAVGLFREVFTNPLTRAGAHPVAASRGFLADNKLVLSNPWARFVLLAAAIEFAFLFGAFAYIGADLHLRFGLGFTAIGLVICMFGVGGLVYALWGPQFVVLLGQRGLAAGGGLICGAAFLVLAATPVWWIAPIGVAFVGLGFYMLHNTLQTNATQMSPEARGTAVGLYSASLYLGQTAGIAIAAPVFDRHGAQPAFAVSGIVLAMLGVWFARGLKRRGG